MTIDTSSADRRRGVTPCSTRETPGTTTLAHTRLSGISTLSRTVMPVPTSERFTCRGSVTHSRFRIVRRTKRFVSGGEPTHSCGDYNECNLRLWSSYIIFFIAVFCEMALYHKRALDTSILPISCDTGVRRYAPSWPLTDAFLISTRARRAAIYRSLPSETIGFKNCIPAPSLEYVHTVEIPERFPTRAPI